MNDDFDWNDEDELAPEGPPEELLHLAMTCNGSWGLSIKDALQMREHMNAGKPPEGDSSWKNELEDMRDHAAKVYEAARHIAWKAYRQGILHGEELAKFR
jgi:hypothetical protein